MKFFDIHTHMIPEIDDGSKSEDMTYEMLKLSYDSGVRDIILTSHFNELRNQIADVREHFAKVKEIAKKISPDLSLYIGNEIFYTVNSTRLLNEGKIATLADSKYVLIEFRYDVLLEEIAAAVNQIQMGGYYPIIAHIERYECMHDVKAVKQISAMGAYMQVNAGYISNAKFMQSRFLNKLFKENLISFIGTDCHNTTSRRPNMKECADYLNKKYGTEFTQELLYENPQKIINKERI